MSILDWSGAIRVTFDKEIVNDPAVYTEEVIKQTVVAATASGSYNGSSQPGNAFDGNPSSAWIASGGAGSWIKADFGAVTAIDKVRLLPRTYYVTKEYAIQGSNDDTSWTTVASGQLATNSSVWTDITFAEASYRYWRVLVVSTWDPYEAGFYEIEFYGVVRNYEVAGWMVTGQEYDKVPGGELQTATYGLRRVTRSEDELSVILWLKLDQRLLNPQGLVTVSYDKETGNLIGAGNVPVDDFSISFTPTNITPIFNPQAQENISLSVSGIAARHLIHFIDTADNENISLSVSAVAVRYHIDDIEQ